GVWEEVPGGAEGNRTPDLLIANEALYHLSYGPRKARNKAIRARPVKPPLVAAPSRLSKHARPPRFASAANPARSRRDGPASLPHLHRPRPAELPAVRDRGQRHPVVAGRLRRDQPAQRLRLQR